MCTMMLLGLLLLLVLFLPLVLAELQAEAHRGSVSVCVDGFVLLVSKLR